MKKIIDFIAKEIVFCSNDYQTKSDNTFFMGLFHLILLGLPPLIMLFGGAMIFVAIIITAKNGIGFSYPWFLWIAGSFLIGYFFKKIRVRLFYQKDD